MNALPIDKPDRTNVVAEEQRAARDGKPSRPSRAAEYIAALYVALVLCTPWLLREASLLTPPSKGVEMQMSKAAPTPPTVELKVPAKPARNQTR